MLYIPHAYVLALAYIPLIPPRPAVFEPPAARVWDDLRIIGITVYTRSSQKAMLDHPMSHVVGCVGITIGVTRVFTPFRAEQ